MDEAVQLASMCCESSESVDKRRILKIARNYAMFIRTLHHSKRLREFCLATSSQHDVRAKRSGHDRRRTAYAGRGTGDKDTPSGEIHGVH